MVTIDDTPCDPGPDRASARPAVPRVPAQRGPRGVARTRAVATSIAARRRPRGMSTRARWAVMSAAALVFAAISAIEPGSLPVTAVVLWLLAGMVVLRPVFLLLDAAVLGSLVALAVLAAGRSAPFGPTLGLVLFGALVLGNVLHRDRRAGPDAIGDVDRAEAVLIDLRDRARSHADLPELPHGWHVETDLRSAHGGAFCGDFLVAGRRDDWLEVVLVDVSGKGEDAAGRALLLTGAFGALLEALPRDGFLPAANRYVLRHAGEEGFATAVHVSVHLPTGAYLAASAGHPPVAHFRAGSGRWTVLEAEGGPLLGVLPDADYPASLGHLDPGDALLLYTDGLVEYHGMDVARGIDRLLGQADRTLARGGPGGAAVISEATGSGAADDRALVVVRRSRAAR